MNCKTCKYKKYAEKIKKLNDETIIIIDKQKATIERLGNKLNKFQRML